MLSPLVQWRDPAAVPEGRAAFRLDPGRIIACKGEAGRRQFETMWERGGEAAGGRLLELKRGAPEFHAGEALFIRALAGRVAGARLAELEPQLEAHARDGGSVLIALADELAPPAATQALLPAQAWSPDAPRLLDDQGLPLRYARQGDWVQLQWPVADGLLADAESLTLRCSRDGDEWRSAPQPVADWRPFLAGVRSVIAELAVPWPPGTYRLRLEIAAAQGRRPARPLVLLLTVKPSAVNPLPHEFMPHWRLPGLRQVAPALAGLTLLTPPVATLDLSPASTVALKGEWHEAETRADGGWRRWIGNFAQLALRGDGDIRLDLEDHRVRDASGAPTTVTLFLDGCRHAQWTLARTGPQRLHAPWPDDGLAHLITLSVDPCWSPVDFGHPDDRRRLGVLINRCELSR